MGLAARNRWRLKPRLSDLANHNDLGKVPELLTQLQRGVIAEVSLGAAILLVVAMMGITLRPVTFSRIGRFRLG